MTHFFGPDSPYLTHPLLTSERTAAEVDRVLDHCESGYQSVLDIGCGFGRHAIEFARRGFDVVAIDPSSTMIEEARSRAERERVTIDLREIDASHFSSPQTFDLVVCLFTSFGQVSPGATQDDAVGLLTNAVASLRSGGTLVIELPEKARLRDTLVTSEQLGATTVTRRFDDATSQVHESFMTATHTFDLAYRAYGRQELFDLLAGFDVTVVETLDEALVSPPNTFMTVFAKRK